jgi:hypothetical protein
LSAMTPRPINRCMPSRAMISKRRNQCRRLTTLIPLRSPHFSAGRAGTSLDVQTPAARLEATQATHDQRAEEPLRNTAAAWLQRHARPPRRGRPERLGGVLTATSSRRRPSTRVRPPCQRDGSRETTRRLPDPRADSSVRSAASCSLPIPCSRGARE